MQAIYQSGGKQPLGVFKYVVRSKVMKQAAKIKRLLTHKANSEKYFVATDELDRSDGGALDTKAALTQVHEL